MKKDQPKASTTSNADKCIMCVSWCNADNVMNYGQILQGCAMMMILRLFSTGRVVYASYLPRRLRNLVRCFAERHNPQNGHLRAYLRSCRMLRAIQKENNIELHQVSNLDRLNTLSLPAEILICGSDQIWHPNNFDKGYFLGFGKETAKRYAYAASLPKTKIEPQYAAQMKQAARYLRKFDGIAVREAGSVAMISELSGLPVTAVVDPTYLVDRQTWEVYAEKIAVPERYIFVYVPNGADDTMAECVEVLKERSGIQDVLVMITRGKNCFDHANRLRFVSVGQFLYLIQHAAYVITSSFHAVVFSSIFHREFYCYDVPNDSRGEDIRLSDLLELLGTQDRIVHSPADIHPDREIDYCLVDRRLHPVKMESLDYLARVIGDAH